MGVMRRDIDELYDALARCEGKPPIVAQFLLERILQLDPASHRARHLLDRIGRAPAPASPIAVGIERAEAFAVRGQVREAREEAQTLSFRFGDDPVVQNWLCGFDLLWSGASTGGGRGQA